MKRASYREAVQWIADNDNPADDEPVIEVAGYMTVMLIADIFDTSTGRVAKDVVWRRAKDRAAGRVFRGRV